jgi:hypothetical protein
MIRLTMMLMVLLAVPARAETPAFNCVGALELEDGVFSIPFARNSARLGDAARAPMDAVVEALGAEPGRVACVLGHAGQEGGATTSIRLAAQRARAVTTALTGARHSDRAAAVGSPQRAVQPARTGGNATVADGHGGGAAAPIMPAAPVRGRWQLLVPCPQALGVTLRAAQRTKFIRLPDAVHAGKRRDAVASRGRHAFRLAQA